MQYDTNGYLKIETTDVYVCVCVCFDFSLVEMFK